MERNYSLDVFRIFSMLMIITLHVLGPSNMGGQLLVNTSINYYIAWCFETVCFCGVNCFAMLSGYLNIKKTNMNYKRIFEIYGLLLFYSLLFLIICFPIFPIKKDDIYKCFLPLSSRQDWFTTSYFCLFMFIPYINKGLNSMTQEEYKKLLLICVGLFVLLPIINFQRFDLFMTNRGYSFLWLCVMYSFGAYQRLYPSRVKNKLMIVFVSNLLAYGSKFIVLYILEKLGIEGHENLSMVLIGYTSPFMVINAYILLNYFLNKKIQLNLYMSKIIVFFSSVSFAVLMIHTNQCSLYYLLNGCCEFLANVPMLVLIIIVPIITILIYLLCSAIEGVRRVLFKLTRLRLLLDLIANSIINFTNKMICRIIK